MFNINAKSLKRLAIILGAVIVIMGMIATIGAYAYSGNTDGAAAVTAEASGDGYVANADAAADNTTGYKAIASAIAIGLASCGGAIGMGIFGAKTSEGISRQPEADGKIRTSFMLGLVFIETAIIYSLLVVILIIFVL
jgi:F-type H+-transporting ATPase subunit c